jgi:hypothetical protein
MQCVNELFIAGFAVYFLGLSSMYMMAAIAVDRYIVIAKPFLGARLTNKVHLIILGK